MQGRLKCAEYKAHSAQVRWIFLLLSTMEGEASKPGAAPGDKGGSVRGREFAAVCSRTFDGEARVEPMTSDSGGN